MNRSKCQTSFLILISVLFFISCANKKGADKDSAKEETTVIEKIPSLSMYDYSVYGLQVLEDYKDPKSHLTSIKLGEAINYLGETVTDSASKKEYCKVELSDGTTGWALSKYIVINATPAAVIAATPVYERPDILTKSSRKAYDVIDIVAITEEKDGWCNVTGRNLLNSGWVLKESLSVNKEDFAMAILARKEIFDAKGNILDDKLNDFINNAQFPGSKIVSILRDRLIASVENTAAETPVEEEAEPVELPE
ncbi:MAG: SH3 domain-containing protein [Bacteroidales bacterium]|nr:SH3 domain-containing protein [Bacteroidales bacterium]